MPDNKSFWATLPGIITAIAGILTAITGLIIALNGAGFFSKQATDSKSSTEPKSESIKYKENEVSEKTNGFKETNAQYNLTFLMSQVKIEDHQYTIMSASLNPTTPVNNELAIKIKYKNNSNYSPATFWNEGFRLSVDNSLTPPSGDLNQLVERHAELVGTVTFDVPIHSTDLVLHILDGEKDVSIPITLVPK